MLMNGRGDSAVKGEWTADEPGESRGSGDWGTRGDDGTSVAGERSRSMTGDGDAEGANSEGRDAGGGDTDPLLSRRRA